MNHCQLMLHSLRDIRRMRDIVERSQDERERRAELVGDIGEEAQTLLVEFLLLLVVHLLCPELVLARGGIQLFHTRPIGRNPEFAILRLRNLGNIVGGNAGSILGIIYHAEICPKRLKNKLKTIHNRIFERFVTYFERIISSFLPQSMYLCCRITTTFRFSKLTITKSTIQIR